MDIITEILNISERDVLDCSAHTENNTLIVTVTLRVTHQSCSFCNNDKVVIKEYRLRKITHVSINKKKCVIHYRARRFKCKLCGMTFYEENPFVDQRKTISKIIPLNVLEDLKFPNATFSSVARLNHISIQKVIDIFDAYVEIPRATLPYAICIDEVYAFRHHKDKYICSILDFEKNEIVDILPSRKKHQMANYFTKIPKAERDNVHLVSIDMYNTYRSIARLYLKNAKVCIDSFHVMVQVNKMLKNTRIRIMKSYHRDSEQYYLLKNFNWLLMMRYDKIEDNYPGKYNRKLRRCISYPQLLDKILELSSELTQAYQLKEEYIKINQLKSPEEAKVNIEKYIISLKQYGTKESKKLRTTLNNWFDEIINSYTYLGNKRISSGPIESKNALIKLIKRNANGYKNFERFRNRCIYTINKNCKYDISRKYTSKKMKTKK